MSAGGFIGSFCVAFVAKNLVVQYYELDRIGGRYLQIADEQEKPRSLISLKSKSAVDIYSMADSQQWLNPLIDTTYGSATFIDVSEPAIWELKVSASGLLIRKVKSEGQSR